MTAQHARSAGPEHDAAVDRPQLSARHARLLEFEREWRRHTATKEDAIRRELALTPVRYYQLLDVVIDSPAAVRYDPMLVGQLQRSREARSASRQQRTAVTDLHAGERIRPITAARPAEQQTPTEEKTT